MSHQIKYVVIDVSGLETPFIFPSYVAHAELRRLGTPISAGFCVLGPHGKPQCFGESVGLELSSRPQADAELMERRFFDLFLESPRPSHSNLLKSSPSPA